MTWLLDHASNAIRYPRHHRRCPAARRQRRAKRHRFAYTHPPALALALAQSLDGTWNESMLDVPSARAEHFERVGTINAFRRLLEYGWDKDSPPLLRARRVLFRLLAEDNDPAFLFELAHRGEDAAELSRRGRSMLREAAAAALAQAGYEGDPRLRGAARRILDRIDPFLRSPLAHKPWVRVGQQAGAGARGYAAVDLRARDARVHAAVPPRASRADRPPPALRLAAAAAPGAGAAVSARRSSRSRIS